MVLSLTRLCSAESREHKVKKKSSGIFAGGGAIGSALVFSPLICWRCGSMKSGYFFVMKNPSFVIGGRSLCGGGIM